MNRDLSELHKFYKCMQEYGNRLAELGRELDSEADTAATMLADSVSARSIGKVRECAERLRIIGNHIVSEAEKEVANAKKDIDDFNNLG